MKPCFVGDETRPRVRTLCPDRRWINVSKAAHGAVATAIESEAGRVLIAPAWSVVFKGMKLPVPLSRRLPARTVILHAGNDKLVPFSSSLSGLESAARNTLPAEAATVVAIEVRVDYVAAADYTRDSLLRVVVRGILGRMSLRAG